MKKYFTLIFFPIIAILVLPLIFTIFNLFSIEINKFICTILMVIIMVITGFLLGKKIKDKGYLKGILLGLGISAIMLILSFILRSTHSLYNIVYYLIIIASTTLGTMIGINRK